MSKQTYTPREVISLTGAVDTFLRWKQTKDSRSYKHYHPSEWGKCLRRAQYLRYAEDGLIKFDPREIDSQTLRKFDKGHNMHDRWARYFAEMQVLRGKWRCKNPSCNQMYGEEEIQGVFCPKRCEGCGHDRFSYREITVTDEGLNFKGHCDLVLDFSKFDKTQFNGVRVAFNDEHLPKTPIVADMKTINQDQHKRQVQGKGPHPEYLIQLQIYIQLLGCEYGFLIYENKNSSDLEAFLVKKDDDAFAEIKEQANKMNAMAESNYLPPPRPSRQTDFQCMYCEFSKHCHKAKIWQAKDLDEKREKFYGSLL